MFRRLVIMNNNSNLFEDNGAHFSDDRKFRFALWRIWDKTKPLVMFVGLNPSKADESATDNTITRVKGLAHSWGYGGIYMLNCFPLVSTDPEALEFYRDNLGDADYNINKLREISLLCKEIIFAWGAFKIVQEAHMDRRLSNMFPNAKALIINKDGSPRHPLYVKKDTVPIPFELRLRDIAIKNKKAVVSG